MTHRAPFAASAQAAVLSQRRRSAPSELTAAEAARRPATAVTAAGQSRRRPACVAPAAAASEVCVARTRRALRPPRGRHAGAISHLRGRVDAISRRLDAVGAPGAAPRRIRTGRGRPGGGPRSRWGRAERRRRLSGAAWAAYWHMNPTCPIWTVFEIFLRTTFSLQASARDKPYTWLT